MISMLVCAAVVAGSQGSVEAPGSAQVTYKVKLYDHSGLVSAPKILTLDGQKAAISQKMVNRGFEVVVLPHVNTDSSLTTELNVSIDGCPSLATIYTGSSGAASFIKFSKTKSGKAMGHMPSIAISSQKPRIGREDLLLVITGTVQAPPGSDPFTTSPAPWKPGTPAPAEILYKVIVSNNKGVVASPVVRTLNHYAARIDGLGKLGEVSIALWPSMQPGGDLFTMVDFKIDGDDVSTIASSAKSGTKRFYKLWEEDAATPHVTPLASSHHVRLKPGEWLIEVSGTEVTPAGVTHR